MWLKKTIKAWREWIKSEWPKSRRDRNTIKCSKCGRDTGFDAGRFLVFIPPEGYLCSCGATILLREKTPL